jgi:2-C-methyl-D-erythritol 4-phosphate cytidylyltransferase/2-C-methyl-D-erythritol 2,4-cyclodiphosphate synthase
VINRDDLVAMQTPQGASREDLLRAYAAASGVFTDDAELLRHFGHDVKLVQGNSANFKITTPSDYRRAQGKMGQMEIRTGIGYDIHRFAEETGRVLMLGGVAFPGARALDGHSDADVVLHALTDALLGAAAMGDIGKHFPNTDPAWKDCASSKFLAAARDLLTAENFQIVNVDTTLIGEEPKVMPREKEIRCHIAETLGIEVGRVGFKATTNEGLGAIGRSEGIACFATAALKRG